MDSMKNQIIVWDDEIHKILDKTRLPSEDRETVIDIFRQIAFLWCESDAVTCAFEDEIMSAFPEAYAVCSKPGLLTEKVEEKMEQTYPFGDGLVEEE